MKAFTLIEVMISVTLFALLGVSLFSVLIFLKKSDSGISARADLNRELYLTIESVAKIISGGGTLDYEQYWNLKKLNSSSGLDGYGNYGNGGDVGTTTYGGPFQYCSSGNGTPRNLSTCFPSGTTRHQRYGQYELSFYDFNGDANNDTASCNNQSKPGRPLGDANCDGLVFGDDDDENTGFGTDALTLGTQTEKLLIRNGAYRGTLALIKKGALPTRTYLRHALVEDPDDTVVCNQTTGAGCRGELQMRILHGYDMGFLHNLSDTSSANFGLGDGKIDTWVCAPGYYCDGPEITLLNGRKAHLPTGTGSEWVSLFPPHINISQLEWRVGPGDDPSLEWLEGTNVSSQFARMKITVGFSARINQKYEYAIRPNTVFTTFRLGDDSN